MNGAIANQASPDRNSYIAGAAALIKNIPDGDLKSVLRNCQIPKSEFMRVLQIELRDFDIDEVHAYVDQEAYLSGVDDEDLLKALPEEALLDYAKKEFDLGDLYILREWAAVKNLRSNPVDLREVLEAMDIMEPLNEALSLMRSGQIEQAYEKIDTLIHPRWNRVPLTPKSEVA